MSKLTIVMYHYVRDLVHSRYPGIKGMEYSAFKRQIDFFCHRFSVVTMEQVLEYVSSQGRCDNFPQNAVLLTFDDGYIDNYTFVLPVLEEFHVQGSFFIPGKTVASRRLLDVNKIHYMLASADIGKLLDDVLDQMNYYRGLEFAYPSNDELYRDFAIANRFDSADTIFIKRMLQTVLPERLRNQISSNLFEKYVGVSEEQLAYELYMTKDQIRTMKSHGMFIGIHGYDHYWLGNLSTVQMREDISKALEVMDEFVDKKQWVMNYPYGSYNQEVLDYVSSRGAKLGLTTKVEMADLESDDLLELPRLDCNDFPPKSETYKLYVKENADEGRKK